MDNNNYYYVKYELQDTEEPPKKPDKPKMKTGIKFLLLVLGAIGLGGLAGLACYGVNYLGHTFFPITINQNIYEQPPTGNSAITTIDPISKDDVDITVFDVSETVCAGEDFVFNIGIKDKSGSLNTVKVLCDGEVVFEETGILNTEYTKQITNANTNPKETFKLLIKFISLNLDKISKLLFSLACLKR